MHFYGHLIVCLSFRNHLEMYIVQPNPCIRFKAHEENYLLSRLLKSERSLFLYLAHLSSKFSGGLYIF